MGEYTKVVIGQTTGHIPSPISLGLKNRHLQLIGIGGAIGAGFFLGSGAAISQAGPALLIAYVLTGAVIFLMMRALGEMTLAYPAARSFSSYATQFIGTLAGFITGWSYWLACLLVGVAEMTGAGLLLHHWFPHLPQRVPALCAALLLYGINMRGVRSFGETEYWLTMIKVATIVAVLLCGLAILLFEIGSLGKQSAISNLWAHGGFLPNGSARTSHRDATRHFFLWRNRINRSRLSRDRTGSVHAAAGHRWHPLSDPAVLYRLICGNHDVVSVELSQSERKPVCHGTGCCGLSRSSQRCNLRRDHGAVLFLQYRTVFEPAVCFTLWHLQGKRLSVCENSMTETFHLFRWPYRAAF